MSDQVWQINEFTVEFFEDTHEYLVDGILVPSITSLISSPDKYKFVNPAVLNKAAELGTKVHEAVERWCLFGEESELVELRNFKFLKEKYGFEIIANEIPVILFGLDGYPVSAGRLDLVLKIDGSLGLADIKRTSVLDKEYVTKQLNLYRLAYQQCYGESIEFLRAVHLRENKRRFVDLPINEDMTWQLIAKIGTKK